MKSFTICKSAKMSSECWIRIEVEELDQEYRYQLDEEDGERYEVEYCVSYRDPGSPEWILARWYWNNLGIWIDNALWNDH